MKKLFISIVLTFTSLIVIGQNKPLSLWYKQPALVWTDALPVGNGRMGAMVFGGVPNERIQLNEESIWAGRQQSVDNFESAAHLKDIQQLLFNGENKKAFDLSSKYMVADPARFRSYQTLGDLFIDMGEQGAVKNYSRELDLATGINTTRYQIDSVNYVREVFASAPNDCLIIRITADKPNSIHCKINLSRERDASISSLNNNTLMLSGQVADVSDKNNGSGGLNMKFSAVLRADQDGGKLVSANNSILVNDASSVTIYLTAVSDYSLSELNFNHAINTRASCDSIIGKVIEERFDTLKEAHLKFYQELFNRVSLDLGGEDFSTISTDQRLETLKKDGLDQQLVALYFQYGRYLLISSSMAPGKLPANLQGVWNDSFNAPWDSDYHTNINLQMNYWPAEVTNLTETNKPLFDFIEAYRVPGRITARGMYNADGWMMHHATDIFGKTGVNGSVKYGMSPLAGAWLSLHFWEHYRFTGDKQFLREKAYPVLKEAAEFVRSFLTEDKQGRLVTSPSISPENSFKLPNGEISQITYAPTIDIEIIVALYDACIKSAKLLNTDKSFTLALERSLKRLPSIKISPKTGGIQEWVEDYEEAEPGHRHISHLLGLYPAALITPATPELFAAAARTLENRLANGGGHTGWSRAWIINFYARLLQREKAYDNVLALLQKSTLNNLFDNHPPFQIDGNFGGTAGIAEMLIQSHEDQIKLLPALPSVWQNGSFKGLCARGGFVFNITWVKGRIIKCAVLSKLGNHCRININNKPVELKTEPGLWYELF